MIKQIVAPLRAGRCPLMRVKRTHGGRLPPPSSDRMRYGLFAGQGRRSRRVLRELARLSVKGRGPRFGNAFGSNPASSPDTIDVP